MSLFDTVYDEYGLKTSSHVPGVEKDGWQSKSITEYPSMDSYKLSKDGRLLIERVDRIIVPENERPYKDHPDPIARLWGSLKEVHLEWKDIEYHGIIEIYARGINNKLLTLKLKFTDGVLVKYWEVEDE